MFGALAYNQNKVDSEEAKVLFSNRMLLSEDGNFSIGECMRSFEMQMPVQLSTKKPILHISINPHPEDVLTDQQLSDIAKEYMRKLGYGDQPYLVYKHTDIDRHHIHIVGLRVDENGKPLNDRFEHRRSKQITRELEKKYGLHPAERKERAERPELKKVDYAAGDVKHQIGNTVKATCHGYRFQSFGEYKALLAAYNVCAEEVKGEINGKPYQGIVYSAMNDKGEKAGNPVKASRIGKSVGYEAVQRRMEKSGEAIKNGKMKERTRKIVATAMQTARSRKELEQQLKKQGIDVVFAHLWRYVHRPRQPGGAERFTLGQGVFGERVQRTFFGRNREDAPARSISTATRPAHASGTAGLHSESRYCSGRGFRAGSFRRIAGRRCIRR